MEQPLFYTVDEAAGKLRVDRKTLYDCIARGEIAVVRIGRTIRIPGAWLQSISAAKPASGEAPQAVVRRNRR